MHLVGFIIRIRVGFKWCVLKIRFQNIIVISCFVAGTLMISCEVIFIVSTKLMFLRVATLTLLTYCTMNLLSFISWRYVCIHVCVCVCVYVYVCMLIYMCMYVYEHQSSVFSYDDN